MVYTKKKYLKELKTNIHWEVEPHFWHYCMIKMFKLFKTIVEHKMSSPEVQSALYGEFDREGKPMLDGFIKNFNLNVKFVKEITQSITNRNI